MFQLIQYQSLISNRLQKKFDKDLNVVGDQMLYPALSRTAVQVMEESGRVACDHYLNRCEVFPQREEKISTGNNSPPARDPGIPSTPVYSARFFGSASELTLAILVVCAGQFLQVIFRGFHCE